MLSLETIAGILTKALITGALSEISKRGTKALVEYVLEQVRNDGLVVSKEDAKRVADLLSYQESFASILKAQFKTKNRRGICFIGPSGAGKTELWQDLTSKRSNIRRPTSERDYGQARFGSRIIKVVDTPGSQYHVNIDKEVYKHIETNKIDILVLVLAGGYLDTVDMPGLRRPGETTTYKTLPAFLSHNRYEEIQWLKELLVQSPPKKLTARHLMVVLNKMDHWYDSRHEVLDYYENKGPADSIKKAAAKFCRPDVQPSFHCVAARYNSFKGSPPCGNMSEELSISTRLILRTEILRRYL